MSNVIIPNARLSYPSLFQEAEFEGKKGKFEATFLFPKTDKKTYNAIMKAIDLAIENKEGVTKIKSDNMCIRDGDEIFEEKEEEGKGDSVEAYKGMWCVKAANSKRPTMINRDKTQIVEEDNILYAGCYVNASINPWIQSNSYGKRANANLLGLQFVKDGEPFGDAVVASADEFDDISEDEDEDDL